MLSLSQSTQDAAYTKLCEIILKHKSLIAKSEMSRLARERLFYQANSIQYKRLVDQSRRVDADTTDNLIKMALHINKQAKADLLTIEYEKISGSSIVNGDMEGGNIEQRVSQNRANELLVEWKKVLIEYEREGNDVEALFTSGTGTSQGLINETSSTQLESLKDKLFIATGEDQIDTWEAFEHYQLATRLTEEDK